MWWHSPRGLKPGFHYPSWRPELTARVDGWPVSITRRNTNHYANDAKTFLKHLSDCLFYFCSTCVDVLNAGVLNGQPRNASGKQCISVIVGQRELKWRVRDILARPGLRRETWLFSQTPTDDLAVTPAAPPRPWTFKTAASVCYIPSVADSFIERCRFCCS